MNELKYRPMAVTGFSALAVMLVSILSGYSLICGIALLALGTVTILVLAVTKRFSSLLVLDYFCAACIFAGILLIGSNVFGVQASQKYSGVKVNICAEYQGEMPSGEGNNVYLFKTQTINEEKIKTKIAVRTNSDFDFNCGDVISFTAKPEKTTDPGNLSDEIFLTAFINNGNFKYILIESGENSIVNTLESLRATIKRRILSFLPGENGGLAVAMLLGDKSEVSSNTLNNFSTTGVSHLFAVSGLHLSVWVLSFYVLFQKLKIKKKLACCFTIIFVLWFTALAGFTPSVVRAGLMLSVFMLAEILSESSDSLNSLGFSIFVILAFNPMSAVSVSLILSVCAVLGITTLYPLAERYILIYFNLIRIKPLRKFVKGCLSVFFVSICASLFTLIPTVFFFGSFSLIAPVTNIFTSFPATVMMISGGLSALFYPLEFIGRPCALVCGILSKYLQFITSHFAKIPYASINAQSVFLKATLILIVCVIIAVVLLTDSIKARVKGIVSSVLCISIVAVSVFSIYTYDLTQFKVINVGDGISVYVKHGGYSMLLGCGGSDYYSGSSIFKETDNSIDLLVVPNDNRWNSKGLYYLSERCNAERVVFAQDSRNLSLIYPENEISSFFALNPWDGASVEVYNNNGTAYAYCSFSGTDVFILFDSDENTIVPEKCKSADIIILSYYLPIDFDGSSSKYTVLSSTEEICESVKLNLKSQNIYSTYQSDFIEFDIRNNGKIKTFRE